MAMDFKVTVETLKNAKGMYLLTIAPEGACICMQKVMICVGMDAVHRHIRDHYYWLAFGVVQEGGDK